jgi:glyoxylase-like metal-dependent hydrolase (beta-lactamase superfamily II)
VARIHHLNCATLCPYNARLLSGAGGWREPARLVAHVLAIESSDGIVLVDTGLGTADCSNPGRTGGLFKATTRPCYDVAETAIEQLRELGFAPADVRNVLVTHLDVDHAGGLGDFPNARVHVFRTELEAALNPRVRERSRYVPEQWAHGPTWVPYETEGDTWFGFESVRAIEGLDVEVAIVPITGHSRGHSAIAVRSGEGWLLHCGDGYFHRGEMERPPATPVGIRLFQSLVEVDRRRRLANQDRLRRLKAEHGSEVEVFCAHDPVELERLRGTAG